MKIKEKVRSKEYIDEYGSGTLEPYKLYEMFLNVSKLLFKNGKRNEYLLYPLQPRELEVRHIMCEILKTNKYYHMLECPIHNPIQKAPNRASFVDLSVYTENGIIDIELKKSPSDVERDFPKLIASESMGCAIFYLFNGKEINRQFRFIIDRYENSYINILENLNNRGLVKDKWLLFFLLAYEERKIFSKIYDSISSIDFFLIKEKGYNLSGSGKSHLTKD